MQEDFHYYATYCAAFLAGYSHEESLDIAYSAQFVDLCSRSFLSKIHGPSDAATTQLSLELMDARTDILGLQDITRIWASFHFLPKDLYAEKKGRTRRYMYKYRLICGPNGSLVKDTVTLAKDKPVQSVGIAMHVLADTWAHSNFAGTPSLVINNTDYDFTEILGTGENKSERAIKFRHSTSVPDDLENGIFTNSITQTNENSIMNLGHGRAGHLPDYCFMRYKYVPAWGDYTVITKDNPSDYRKAFCQMIYAMKFIRGESEKFELETYDYDAIENCSSRIQEILEKRQLIASDDWKIFGEELSGESIADFELEKYTKEYIDASKDSKKDTFLGKFIDGAIAQKSMVTNRIYKSKNVLAGFSKEIFRIGDAEIG
ncbi:DUF6765 family protein [Butyrivibrio sp. MC2021]|uniref:DUF6765 family protein n=1 Tax=Butyrivibrio sp. MC2021 TaxID=1408306 RepID=UPI000478B098|nr:DUF6765 family protein [Butyrivibrio sp. MC2021]